MLRKTVIEKVLGGTRSAWTKRRTVLIPGVLAEKRRHPLERNYMVGLALDNQRVSWWTVDLSQLRVYNHLLQGRQSDSLFFKHVHNRANLTPFLQTDPWMSVVHNAAASFVSVIFG